MYLTVIILLMAVLPIASIVVEYAFFGGGDLVLLVGKWFVFWAVGIRLLLAGVRQTVNPEFTAREIFDIKDPAALITVQELGFANLAFGTLGVFSLFVPAWIPAAALAGGLFYGLAGVRHAMKAERNQTESIAMISDLFIFVILAGYFLLVAMR